MDFLKQLDAPLAMELKSLYEMGRATDGLIPAAYADPTALAEEIGIASPEGVRALHFVEAVGVSLYSDHPLEFYRLSSRAFRLAEYVFGGEPLSISEALSGLPNWLKSIFIEDSGAQFELWVKDDSTKGHTVFTLFRNYPTTSPLGIRDTRKFIQNMPTTHQRDRALKEFLAPLVDSHTLRRAPSRT